MMRFLRRKRERRDRRAEAGRTLVQVMTSVAITASVSTAAVTSMVKMYTSGAEELVIANVNVQASEAIDRMAGELRRGRVQTPSLDGSSILYQVPVDADGDGFVLGTDGEIDWGAMDGGSPSDGTHAMYRFVADAVLIEANVGDVNGDGDELDVFDRGRIERVEPSGGTHQLTGPWVLQPQADYGGDIDGDGVADPIFATTATGSLRVLSISLTLVIPSWADDWVTTDVQLSFDLLNDQL